MAKPAFSNGVVVDQVYMPNSIRAQSGAAVRSAIPQYVYSHYKDSLTGSPASKIQQIIDMAEALTHTVAFVGGSATVIIDESFDFVAGDTKIDVKEGVELLPSGYRTITVGNTGRTDTAQSWFEMHSNTRIGAFKFVWDNPEPSSAIIFASPGRENITVDCPEFDIAVTRDRVDVNDPAAVQVGTICTQLIGCNNCEINRPKMVSGYTGVSLLGCDGIDVKAVDIKGYSGQGIFCVPTSTTDSSNIRIVGGMIGAAAPSQRFPVTGGSFPRQPIAFQSNIATENKDILIKDIVVILPDTPSDGENNQTVSNGSADAVSVHRGNNVRVVNVSVYGAGELGFNFSTGCVNCSWINCYVDGCDLGAYSVGVFDDYNLSLIHI